MTSAFRPEVREKLPALIGLRFLINTSTRMTYAFLSPLAAGAGLSRESMSLVIGARDLTSLTSPAVGSVSGRVGYAAVLRGGVALVVAGSMLSVFGAAGLIVGFVVFGLGRTFYQIAATTWIADSVAYERRGRATGYIEMAWGGSALLGVPLMGLLIDGVAWWAGFAALAVLSVPLGVIVARQHAAPGARPTQRSRRARLDRNAIAVLVAYGAMTLASQFLFIGQALWFEDDYGFDPSQVGFAVLTFGAVEVCATFLLAQVNDRMGKRNAMVTGIALMASGMVALAASGTPPIAAALGLVVVTSFGFEFGVVSGLPLITELDPGARSSMIGYSVGVATVVRAGGTYVAAVLYAAAGFGGLMWVGAALGAASVLIGVFVVEEPDGASVTA